MRFEPTPDQRRKYSGYDVEIREARRSKVRVFVDSEGIVMRVHTVVKRIPSEKKFVVLHLIGRTDDERVFGERYGDALTRGHWARYGKWLKRRRPEGTYYFEQMVGVPAPDPFMQLELELMIDATTEVTA